MFGHTFEKYPAHLKTIFYPNPTKSIILYILEVDLDSPSLLIYSSCNLAMLPLHLETGFLR